MKRPLNCGCEDENAVVHGRFRAEHHTRFYVEGWLKVESGAAMVTGVDIR